MRDTKHGHRKEEMEGAGVCCSRHRWRGLSIGVCHKGVVETVGERPKKRMCAMDGMLREGEGEEGVCMHN